MIHIKFYENGLPIFKNTIIHLLYLFMLKQHKKKYPDFMTWEQIKRHAKYGEISLHSYSHKQLMKLSTNEEIFEDTKNLWNIWKKKLGFKPKGYTYPFGIWWKSKRTNKNLILNIF